MKPRRIHIVGIGGIGLSAIAKILLAEGWKVSGSDQSPSPLLDELRSLGAAIRIGHSAENIGDAELVLATSAAHSINPELEAARQRHIPVVKRSEFFPILTEGKQTIAVSGTHGKTTTTGMIATILTNAGLDPSVIVGGIIPELEGNSRAGKGEYFVIEADEYDGAFLGLSPTLAVVTSIEMDHPDIYKNVDEVQKAFEKFMAAVPGDGLVIGFGDSRRVVDTIGTARARKVTFGFDPANNWRTVQTRPNSQGGTDLTVLRENAPFGDYELRIPGTHNVLNALAAIAVSDAVGVDKRVARDTLAGFRGAARRFQIKGEFAGITIVDDYAHHPSEIRATLAAARMRFPKRQVWAVFQPHTFSRTQALLGEFAESFTDADHVIVTEIYAAREHDTLGVSGRQIVDRMSHPDARFTASLDTVIELIASRLNAGDVLITLGAGDVNRVGTGLQAKLQGERNV